MLDNPGLSSRTARPCLDCPASQMRLLKACRYARLFPLLAIGSSEGSPSRLKLQNRSSKARSFGKREVVWPAGPSKAKRRFDTASRLHCVELAPPRAANNQRAAARAPALSVAPPAPASAVHARRRSVNIRQPATSSAFGSTTLPLPLVIPKHDGPKPLPSVPAQRSCLCIASCASSAGRGVANCRPSPGTLTRASRPDGACPHPCQMRCSAPNSSGGDLRSKCQSCVPRTAS